MHHTRKQSGNSMDVKIQPTTKIRDSNKQSGQTKSCYKNSYLCCLLQETNEHIFVCSLDTAHEKTRITRI